MSSAALTALTLAVPSAVAKDVVEAVTANAAVDPETAALAPLRDLAAAVGEQGRGDFADAFTGISIDRKNNQVIVYGTDEGRSKKMTGAAKQKHAGIDTGRVKYVTAKYSRKDLDASLDRIMEVTKSSDAAHLEVYSAAAAPDGSGIQVTVAASALDHVRAQFASNGIPVTVTAGEAPQPFTWRWNDGRAFIGGDVLVGDGHKAGSTVQCTAGLAAEDNNGQDYLITADHCFSTGYGSYVYGDGNPSVGSWSYLSRGGYMGYIGSDHPQWDAQTIVTDYYNGNGTNSDEADQPEGRWYAVTSAAYSYDGDSVCQDGARSYYDGHGVPCGITVTNDDVRYNLTWNDGTVVTARGVKGSSSGWVGEPGDSGALVFSISGSSTRQARGIVSGGEGGTLYWTEAPDILNSWNLHLNPHT
ncbi:hypothetical protein ACFY00_31595 [Kitasatospora sp. NPDC001540]|uniref:hypothetical protein n=1 Tax=Kitasatospora sp. NPDC001540 TaxID=3364014 RepID=UPI00368C40AD